MSDIEHVQSIAEEFESSLLVIALLFLVTGLYFARENASRRSVKPVTKQLRQSAISLLALLCFLASLVPFYRGVAPSQIAPHFPQSRIFTAGIWTIHFSLDQSMWDSSRRIESLIHDLDLDIVGLLESDLHRTVFGNRDMTQYLAESLGMYADIGPGPDKHTWGAALLSKVRTTMQLKAILTLSHSSFPF